MSHPSIVTVRVPRELHAGLKRVALEKGYTLNAFCVGALLNHLPFSIQEKYQTLVKQSQKYQTDVGLFRVYCGSVTSQNGDQAAPIENTPSENTTSSVSSS